MEANLPSWSKEAIGRVVSKNEFLNSPQIQEQIFEYKFNQYLKKYGTVEDALSMWHSGRPLHQAQNAVDKATGLRTTHYVQKITADINAADESRFLQYSRSEDISAEVIHDSSINSSISTPVGNILLANTVKSKGTPYKFGGKSLDGGIDCSGWIAQNTIDCMERLSRNLGVPFNMSAMKDLLNQGAAWQVSEIGKLAGFYSRDTVMSGNLPAGSIIGIRRNNIPKWAQGRPFGISHVVQVVEVKGKKFISESSSSKGGVVLTPMNAWLKENIGQQFYATNPFNLVDASSSLRQ
jgi:hypothetical protein